MALGLNLSRLATGPVLILNASIITLLEKPTAADRASEKITHISGASIFDGSTTVQL